MSLLEFMQRLAALVPRPQLLLIRFHGVLAPNAKPLPQVVPQGPLAQEEPATKAAATAEYDVGDRPGTVAPHQLGAAAQAGLAIEGEMKIIAAIHEPSSGQ